MHISHSLPILFRVFCGLSAPRQSAVRTEGRSFGMVPTVLRDFVQPDPSFGNRTQNPQHTKPHEPVRKPLCAPHKRPQARRTSIRQVRGMRRRTLFVEAHERKIRRPEPHCVLPTFRSASRSLPSVRTLQRTDRTPRPRQRRVVSGRLEQRASRVQPSSPAARNALGARTAHPEPELRASASCVVRTNARNGRNVGGKYPFTDCSAA